MSTYLRQLTVVDKKVNTFTPLTMTQTINQYATVLACFIQTILVSHCILPIAPDDPSTIVTNKWRLANENIKLACSELLNYLNKNYPSNSLQETSRPKLE